MNGKELDRRGDEILAAVQLSDRANDRPARFPAAKRRLTWPCP